MLRYNNLQIIELINPAEKLPVVKKLLEEYKDVNLLQKIFVYVYNTYHRESIYNEYTINERKDRICLDLFENKIRPEYFEDNKIIKDFIDLFVEMTMTAVERDHERCKKDIEDLHLHISSIPFIYKKTITRNVSFENPNKKGEIKIEEVDVVIDIDNSEEKIKALNTREKLYALDQKLRKLVEVEKVEKELSAKTMFER